MKVLIQAKNWKKFLWPAAFLLVVAVFVTVGITVYRNASAPEDVLGAPMPSDDTIAVLSALDRFGAVSAESAIEIWAGGVLERNGAQQYSVMSSDLKDAYILTLGEGGWVFDVKNPTYVNYAVSGITEKEDGSVSFTLSFLQEGDRETEAANASLVLAEEDGRMVVTSLEIDPALSPYTGIK